ncbi:hypothetical protein LguiA_018250 [Lonicera macranthoides]
MISKESERNCYGLVVRYFESEGFVAGIEDGVGGTRTYKRQKRRNLSRLEAKLVEDRMVSVNSAVQLIDKTKEEPQGTGLNNNFCDQVRLASMDSQPYTNGSNNCTVKYWRNIVLEQMYQSPSVSKGGLQECIETALGFCPEKEPIQFDEERHKCSKRHWMLNGTQIAAKRHVGLMPNGSVGQSYYRNNTELCKRAFSDILMSENFTELCNLLLQNFDGVKVDCVFDVSTIDSRMKEGAYEGSPMLFHSDIQRVYIYHCTGLVAISRSLLDKSRTSYSQQQFPTQESTAHFKSDIFTGASPREDCVACETLNPPSQIPIFDGIRTNEEPLQELVTSNGMTFPHCNICQHEVLNQEELKICSHFSCPRKYYHTRCITSTQLESYGPCWYCPSCLCQACLSDRDDDKIIICDGCDNANHIYCTRPPLGSIPEGKWFCTKCREGINNVRKTRRVYLRKQKKLTKKTNENFVGIQTNEEPIGEFEENSSLLEENGFQLLVSEEMNLKCCFICHQEVENHEESKICSHVLCPHKFYHSKCLTSMQVESYGPCWYCPSCLCRVCLSDRDDDKVILCDDCDHGYHIYCTRPPLGSIPEGRWSCPKCVEAKSECVRKPKRTFRRKQRLKEKKEEREAYESLQTLKKDNDIGGVDLLLAAAKTVNLEESLASLVMDS